jgi:DNA repair protein RecN (Recombination protein N)
VSSSGDDSVLEELHVKDLALIEEVWLEPGPRMTALTGETGAGKTALVGALKLLLGERADSGDVRHGCAETLVEGRFVIGGDELVAKRRVTADGRSRCAIDGSMATVGDLANRLGPAVDLHGQHDHQALLRPPTHVGYLDRWIGAAAETALVAYHEARKRHSDARDLRVQLAERLAEAERHSGYLRFVAEEIGAADPYENEDDELMARLPALQHGEKLAEAAAAAVAAVRDEGGASDGIARARTSLAAVTGVDPALDTIAAALVDVDAALEDAGAELRRYRDSIEHDPRVLDEVMARLSTLAGLKKKYGPTLDDVLRNRDEALSTLEAFELGESGLADADRRVAEAEGAYRSAAKELAAVRASAAPAFAEALVEAAAELALVGAGFEVALEELDFERWRESGPHAVEFLYRSAPGAPARPLVRIASGGEVSRVMLALKSVLGAADHVPILVFDEIDAGIGGAAASAVGRRLASLAQTHQVIVVTHLAQVAAYADRHLLVTKTVSGEGAHTEVCVVEGEQRVAEIARMLSGDAGTSALAHARDLLEQTASEPFQTAI